MTEEWFNLYWHVPPPGQTIPEGVQLFPMNDYKPEDIYIAWAVQRLFWNLSGGLSGIILEHLLQWLISANQNDKLDAANWLKVIVIVHAEFCDRTLAEERTWQTVALITKELSGEFRRIGMVEVLWKTVTSLLNRRLTPAIKFHDVL